MILSSEIEEFLEKVKKIEKPIIVEGKRDKDVLEKFGFKKVLDISGKSLAEVVERIGEEGYEEVVILTDFDEEGRKKFKKLKKFFQSKGIRVDGKLREKIKFLFKVGKIEELSFYLNI